tara:strand:+ start:169 stop:312 length:144 start_codon:yes stop_codon:yes gene_type:complete
MILKFLMQKDKYKNIGALSILRLPDASGAAKILLFYPVFPEKNAGYI